MSGRWLDGFANRRISAGGIAAAKCYSLHNLFVLRDFTYSMSNLVLWTKSV